MGGGGEGWGGGKGWGERQKTVVEQQKTMVKKSRH